MKVLTSVKKIKRGDYTYSLMDNDMVHINNHKTNNKSIMVPVRSILKLLEDKQ